MDIQEIYIRARGGQPISDKERAFWIATDPESLGMFLVLNNPGNVNVSLRTLGYELDFEPNAKQLTSVLQKIIDAKTQSDWDFVLNNFDLNEANITPEFMRELRQYFKF